VDSLAKEAAADQHQLAAAEDAETLAMLDPSKDEVTRLTDAERAAFVKVSQSGSGQVSQRAGSQALCLPGNRVLQVHRSL
jgi:hypothetical protein